MVTFDDNFDNLLFMNEEVKTYRYTVRLRKKPLQGGRFTLILDSKNLKKSRF